MAIDKIPQQAPELEKQVLGYCLLNAISGEELKLKSEMFYVPAHQIIFNAILECNKNGGCDLCTVTQYLRDKGKLDEVGGAVPLTKLTDFISSNTNVFLHSRIIEQKFIARQAWEILQKASGRFQSADDIADIIDNIKDDLTNLLPDPQNEKLKIDPTSDIKEPPVCCFIDQCPSHTRGNFSMIDGKKKAGKTFLLGGEVAAMLTNKMIIGKIQGRLSTEKNMILYFDTEQSPYHANRSVKRICTLAGNPNPSNLIAFGLRPLTPAERLSFIEKTIQQTENLVVVVIDGVRDLLTKGINDETEATTLTSKFLKWTENYDMHMILLLHQNKNDMNARGHIGTELGNKSETIITVTKEKKSNIFIVGCEDSKDIGFEEFAFTVDEDGMIQSSDMPKEEQSKAKNPQKIDEQRHFEVLDSIFKIEPQINYYELQDKIIYGFNNSFGQTACRTFISHYMDKGWISKKHDGNKKYYKYERAIF